MRVVVDRVEKGETPVKSGADNCSAKHALESTVESNLSIMAADIKGAEITTDLYPRTGYGWSLDMTWHHCVSFQHFQL